MRDDGAAGSKESLIRAGRTVGFLEEARTQAHGDPEVAEFAGKPMLDTAISYLPVGGGPVQQAVDAVTEAWLSDEQRRLDEEQTKQEIATYRGRNQQLMALGEQWEGSRDFGPEDGLSTQNYINVCAENGIKHAQGVSGRQVR
jgi:hypothetical protein